jgi:hypothetical protein
LRATWEQLQHRCEQATITPGIWGEGVYWQDCVAHTLQVQG